MTARSRLPDRATTADGALPIVESGKAGLSCFVNTRRAGRLRQTSQPEPEDPRPDLPACLRRSSS